MTSQFTDQLGGKVILPWPPIRIVSLVPSQTELLHDLGLNDEVVGITKFCVHPQHWFETKPRIGGTKTLNLKAITALQPDLIIANREENDELQIRRLMEDYPVWTSDVQSLDDALVMINRVGELVNRFNEAAQMTEAIAASFAKLKPATRKRAAYFIWNQPMMVAGRSTFINNMIQRTGFNNCFANRDQRYPEISLDELKVANPEFILLSSEPFPFKPKHAIALKQCCPNATILFVDGQMFSWYGSRLLKAASYLHSLLPMEQHLGGTP
jgi:ABC-type Fe3+-hydroxamate transport system substrate-binding protein